MLYGVVQVSVMHCVVRGCTGQCDALCCIGLYRQCDALFVQVNLLSLFRSRSLRMPLIISVVMQLSQQLSGINGVSGCGLCVCVCVCVWSVCVCVCGLCVCVCVCGLCVCVCVDS